MSWHPDNEMDHRTTAAWVVLLVCVGCLLIWFAG